MIDCISQGYVSIVVAAVMNIVYIVFSRFEKLSFDRRVRYVRPVAECMKALTEALDLQIAKLLDDIKRTKTATSLSPTAKVCVFLVSSVVLIASSAIYLFLLVIRKLFVNLLIGWKSIGLGSLNIMFAKFIGVVEQLLGVLQIPSYLVRDLLYPFELLYQAADLVDVGSLYRLLTVTCEGTKAPIELFIDSFVLGVAIMFINSDLGDDLPGVEQVDFG